MRLIAHLDIINTSKNEIRCCGKTKNGGSCEGNILESEIKDALSGLVIAVLSLTGRPLRTKLQDIAIYFLCKPVGHQTEEAAIALGDKWYKASLAVPSNMPSRKLEASAAESEAVGSPTFKTSKARRAISGEKQVADDKDDRIHELQNMLLSLFMEVKSLRGGSSYDSVKSEGLEVGCKDGTQRWRAWRDSCLDDAEEGRHGQQPYAEAMAHGEGSSGDGSIDDGKEEAVLDDGEDVEEFEADEDFADDDFIDDECEESVSDDDESEEEFGTDDETDDDSSSDYEEKPPPPTRVLRRRAAGRR